MAEPELPDLKKQDRERKKGGAFWWSSSPANSFTGANGAAAAAARSAASAAQAQAGRSGLAQLLAKLGATTAGKLVLGGAAAAGLGACGLAAYAFMTPAAAPSGGLAPLGAIASSSMRPRASGISAGLETLRRAAGGEIKFDPDPPAPAPQPPQEEAATPQPAAQEEPFERPDQATDRLPHNLSGAKLSDGLGSQFGGKNVFANAAAPRFGETLNARMPQFNASRGASTSMKGGKKARGVAAGRSLRGRAQRAMGQLKMARMLSGRANQPTHVEASKTLAADAFDQRISAAGQAPASPIDGAGTQPTGGGGVAPIGTGAPDVTGAPGVGGYNQTPYQGDLNSALNAAAQAGKLKKQAMMLLAIGLVLMAAGAALMATGFASAVGAVLLALGAVLIGMSVMMNQMSKMMADQAKTMAQTIQRVHGQQEQGERINTCTDQAVASGELPENCRPSDTPMAAPATHIQRDAQIESNQTYTIDGGGPVGP